jgi:hypothetical protein
MMMVMRWRRRTTTRRISEANGTLEGKVIMIKLKKTTTRSKMISNS